MRGSTLCQEDLRLLYVLPQQIVYIRELKQTLLHETLYYVSVGMGYWVWGVGSTGGSMGMCKFGSGVYIHICRSVLYSVFIYIYTHIYIYMHTLFVYINTRLMCSIIAVYVFNSRQVYIMYNYIIP
jgi:hypothetical protein